jgi:hypothetical protein
VANLARVLAKRGDVAAARAQFERADAILARRLEPDHPRRVELAAELAAVKAGTAGGPDPRSPTAPKAPQ